MSFILLPKHTPISETRVTTLSVNIRKQGELLMQKAKERLQNLI